MAIDVIAARIESALAAALPVRWLTANTLDRARIYVCFVPRFAVSILIRQRLGVRAVIYLKRLNQPFTPPLSHPPTWLTGKPQNVGFIVGPALY